MKEYWEIPGPDKAPQLPCIAFYKYDGSNLRFEWSKKRGWYKFGTRHRLFDKTDPDFGSAIDVFLDTYGDSLPKTVLDNKDYRGVDNFIAYCEYFGPNSFAAWHADEAKEVMLIDINLTRKGIVLPRDFVRNFGHLKIAEVIYEGNFNQQFVQDVKDGKYPVKEGVVAKGILPNKNNPQHGLWMVKIKTKWWMDELRRRSEQESKFASVLSDNVREQG